MLRRPYVALAIGVFAAWRLWAASSDIAYDASERRATPAVVATLAMAYAALATTVLFGRVFERRDQRRAPDEVLTAMRWAFAVSPVVFGFCAVGFGGHTWVAALGAAVTVALCAVAARDAATRAATSGPS